MFVADCFDVNEKGHLTIGGCDTVGLAKEYGTPLYVMDEMTIRQACRLYQKSFQENYDGHGMAFYASKALNCKEQFAGSWPRRAWVWMWSPAESYTQL